MLEQARRSNNNPMELLKQVTKNYSPEQFDNLFERAKQFGIPEDILNETQNQIKEK
jgi:hypothetical protein